MESVQAAREIVLAKNPRAFEVKVSTSRELWIRSCAALCRGRCAQGLSRIQA